EAADDAFRVVVRRHRLTFTERRADDDHIFRDRWRRVQTNFAGFQIDRLAIAVDDALFQVDDAVRPERADHRAGFGVQLDQAIAGREIDDAIVAPAIGPKRHPAAGELPRRQ